MANLHQVREALVFGYLTDLLDKDEFMLLYDFNKPSNPEFQYYKYQPFDLDGYNDECNAYFRYGDMIKNFTRDVTQLCQISTHMLNLVYSNQKHLVETLDRSWLSSEHLMRYAEVVHAKGAALKNCWGFVNGTVRPICRPQEHQRVVYNGHKRIHAFEYQSVTAANGLVAHLLWPIEGRRHDCFESLAS